MSRVQEPQHCQTPQKKKKSKHEERILAILDNYERQNKKKKTITFQMSQFLISLN